MCKFYRFATSKKITVLESYEDSEVRMADRCGRRWPGEAESPTLMERLDNTDVPEPRNAGRDSGQPGEGRAAWRIHTDFPKEEVWLFQR